MSDGLVKDEDAWGVVEALTGLMETVADRKASPRTASHEALVVAQTRAALALENWVGTEIAALVRMLAESMTEAEGQD